jgi:FkbM family methyltransferase
MFSNFQKFINSKFTIKKPIFIDVGANKGEWSHTMSKKYPDSKIYCFEPIKGITRKNKNIVIINKAVDRKVGNKKFFITRKNVTSSLLHQERTIIDKFKDIKDKKGKIHKKSDYDIVKKINVKTIPLEKFVKSKKLQNIHYLKIDAEGNDLNVLKSLKKEITKIWAFELETWNEKKTLWKKQKNLSACLKFIKKKDFTVVKRIIHGQGRTTDLICINNIYLKD